MTRKEFLNEVKNTSSQERLTEVYLLATPKEGLTANMINEIEGLIIEKKEGLYRQSIEVANDYDSLKAIDKVISKDRLFGKVNNGIYGLLVDKINPFVEERNKKYDEKTREEYLPVALKLWEEEKPLLDDIMVKVLDGMEPNRALEMIRPKMSLWAFRRATQGDETLRRRLLAQGVYAPYFELEKMAWAWPTRPVKSGSIPCFKMGTAVNMINLDQSKIINIIIDGRTIAIICRWPSNADLEEAEKAIVARIEEFLTVDRPLEEVEREVVRIANRGRCYCKGYI